MQFRVVVITDTHNRQDRLQYTALQLLRSVKKTFIGIHLTVIVTVVFNGHFPRRGPALAGTRMSSVLDFTKNDGSGGDY